jgi:integrase
LRTAVLKWSDVDFANKRIHVNRSLAHIPKSGYTLTTLKTKSSKRQIPIPEFVLNELRSHKDIQDEWKELVDDLYQNQDLVICTNTGTMQESTKCDLSHEAHYKRG